MQGKSSVQNVFDSCFTDVVFIKDRLPSKSWCATRSFLLVCPDYWIVIKAFTVSVYVVYQLLAL